MRSWGGPDFDVRGDGAHGVFRSHGVHSPACSPSRDCAWAGSSSLPRGEQRRVPGAAFICGINLNSN